MTSGFVMYKNWEIQVKNALNVDDIYFLGDLGDIANAKNSAITTCDKDFSQITYPILQLTLLLLLATLKKLKQMNTLLSSGDVFLILFL